MAQVEMHVTDLLTALWMCPECKIEPGPLEPQDAFVWRKKGMTVEDALIVMIDAHNNAVGHNAKIVDHTRQYIDVC